MKTNFIQSSLITLGVILALQFLAQPLAAQVRLDNISLGTSLWLRTYNTPDERSVLVNPPTENGANNPTPIVHISTEISIFKGLGLQGRIGYGQDKYNSVVQIGNLNREEKLNQLIIPGSLGVFYKISLNGLPIDPSNSPREDRGWSIAAGAGVNRYFLQHQISRTVSSAEGNIDKTNYNGNNYGLYSQLSVQKSIGESFLFSLDGRYNTGSYFQKVYNDSANGESVRTKISLQGWELGLRFAYVFN